MKTFTALEAKTRFGQLIEAAQSEPVTVTKQGRPSVVILSAQEYQRRQSRAWRKLLSVMEDAGRYASEQGLTEEALDTLLADDS